MSVNDWTICNSGSQLCDRWAFIGDIMLKNQLYYINEYQLNIYLTVDSVVNRVSIYVLSRHDYLDNYAKKSCLLSR